MKRTIKEEIHTCSECRYFDDNGGNDGTMCEYQLRHPDGSWVILDDTCDPYDAIHELCPRLKGEDPN